MAQHLTHPWEPIYNADSRVLILGTFPSVRSRAEGFYFGHPQNVFWRILADALHVERLAEDATIADKTAFLLEHNIALWDVLHSCCIEGSSDASITSPVANTFAPLIAASNIDAIFTTGKTATKFFNTLAAEEAGMRAVYLPSTSPANRATQAKPSFLDSWQNVGRILRDELVTAKSMKEADRYTIEQLGIPSLTLMERAAQAVVDELLTHIQADSSKKKGVSRTPQVLCVCGTGNNGGDGLAVARLLTKQGIAAEALMVGNLDRLSPDCSQQFTWAEEADVPVHTNDLSDFDSKGTEGLIVVDALFGIGLARPLTGTFRKAVDAMNNAQKNGARLLAVDIPSGISADTGEELGNAVHADATVTFAYNKLGMTIEPGQTAAGKIVVADIGIITKRA